MTRKLWFNIFIRVAVIFICTLLIIILANSTLLYRYFLYEEKQNIAQQAEIIARSDFSDTEEFSETLRDIREEHNTDIEIFNQSDLILYTTQGDKLMAFMEQNRNDRFSMSRRPLDYFGKAEQIGNATLQSAKDKISGEEYIVCTINLEDGNRAELKAKVQLIENSAEIAGRFISFITAICFVIAVVWVFLFARKFSKPIAEMKSITGEMANLNFSRRVPQNTRDEIGELGASINNMASSLQSTMAELKSANAKLIKEVEHERSLDKMRKQFVANVSHELKTPISIISGYAEGLKLNINSEKRKEYCDVILDESARMNALVLSILELSRYESGQIAINKENCDIKEISENLTNRIFKDANLTVTNSIPKNTLIFADGIQAEQALKSYLENAKSHTETGGEICIFSQEKEDRIRICVYNTGENIEEEKMPLIWQSFYRGDTSHKREASRFGLGLSIVGAIAVLHGTDCGVYNTPNGVCFWIEFHKAQIKS